MSAHVERSPSPAAGLYLPRMARVVEARDLTWQDRLIELSFPEGEDLGHRPGQFVQVGFFGLGEAPISICSSPATRGSFQLCVRRLGNVTRALHQLRPGDLVGVRGPFGNGFPMDHLTGRDCLVVAGGIGLAPLRSVIHTVLADRDRYGRLIVLHGARREQDILFADEIAAWQQDPRNEVLVSVDEPTPEWKGHVGVITTLFPKVRLDPANTVVVAMVGPPVMYRFVLLELKRLGVAEEQVYMSLERRMRCGVGKCGHCQIDHRCVCVDGPVFSGSEIMQMHEAVWGRDDRGRQTARCHLRLRLLRGVPADHSGNGRAAP